MQTIKDIHQNIDLYGSNVFIAALKKQFKKVCYAHKSIPTMGSPAKGTEFIREDLTVKKVIFHRNKEVTVFFDCPQQDGEVISNVAKFF